MKGNGRPRLRDLGLRPGKFPPGRLNAVTDVRGVRVGHVTLVAGEAGRRRVGVGPVRTGVTSIIPGPGNVCRRKFRAAVDTINGYGKATGFEQVRETGSLETPIVLLNTLSVAAGWSALVSWTREQNPDATSVGAVVAECHDGSLNDIAGGHLKPRHVLTSLRRARTGPVEEGNVGAGTGMSSFGFKSGIGTASRVVPRTHGGYTVGVLVLANTGTPGMLRLCGLPVGTELLLQDAVKTGPRRGVPKEETKGSIIVVLATDAPMLERQLGRLARRAVHGLARVGMTSTPMSGDFAIAFSTANRVDRKKKRVSTRVEELSETHIGAYLEAAVEATEEAFLNGILRCETMAGCDGKVVEALPLERLKELLVRARAFLSCRPGRPTHLPGP